MLRSRWLSTFTVIGALLVALGIAGLIMGHRFVFDPGQPATGNEAWYYLLIGALMILNGALTPAHPEEKSASKAGSLPNSAKNGATGTGTTSSREVAVSTADQKTE